MGPFVLPLSIIEKRESHILWFFFIVSPYKAQTLLSMEIVFIIKIITHTQKIEIIFVL